MEFSCSGLSDNFLCNCSWTDNALKSFYGLMESVLGLALVDCMKLPDQFMDLYIIAELYQTIFLLHYVFFFLLDVFTVD